MSIQSCGLKEAGVSYMKFWISAVNTIKLGPSIWPISGILGGRSTIDSALEGVSILT